MKTLAVGTTGCYILDLSRMGYDVKQVVKIDRESALNWVRAVNPETNLGCGLASEPRVQWLNKLYVVVGEDEDKGGHIALYNHDGGFWVYRLTKKEQ